MDVLTLNNCRIDRDNVTVKLVDEGIAIKKQNGEILTIKKEDIKEVEMFRGATGINLRIFENTIHFINGIEESLIEEIIRLCNDFYKLNVYLKELEIQNVMNGELDVSKKGFIEYRNEKTIFDIPIKSVEAIADIKNEISIKFNNVEIRFVANKEIINEIKDACDSNIEEDLITFESMTMIYPRGKNNFKLYKDYFRVIGYSYDHKIYYKNIKEIYNLDKKYISEHEKYVLFLLNNPIRQGLTKYPLVVLSFGDEKVDFEIEDNRLESRYEGVMSVIFTEIFAKLSDTKVITSDFETSDKTRGLKCTYKAYEGQLYPLDTCLIFLPRSIKIDLKDIYSVEFSRINISALQAKTFDMTISTETNYTFNGLYKEDFGILEKYFIDNNITIRSEVLDEVISSEEESESTDDGFIVSDEDE